MASSHSFLWLSSISLQVYVAHLLYPSSVNGLLCCFHVLVIVNSAVMNIGVRVSFWIIVLSRYMPRSEIAGSYGNSIFSFFEESFEISCVRSQGLLCSTSEVWWLRSTCTHACWGLELSLKISPRLCPFPFCVMSLLPTGWNGISALNHDLGSQSWQDL